MTGKGATWEVPQREGREEDSLRRDTEGCERRSPTGSATPLVPSNLGESNKDVLLPVEEVDAQEPEEEQKEGRKEGERIQTTAWVMKWLWT